MSTVSRTVGPAHVQLTSKSEERRVIFASSLGTVFEWYDSSDHLAGRPILLVSPSVTGSGGGQRIRRAATYVAGICRESARLRYA